MQQIDGFAMSDVRVERASMPARYFHVNTKIGFISQSLEKDIHKILSLLLGMAMCRQPIHCLQVNALQGTQSRIHTALLSKKIILSLFSIISDS